ncbi:hypothetical protein Dimus_021066 [Dionaea muscipula]
MSEGEKPRVSLKKREQNDADEILDAEFTQRGYSCFWFRSSTSAGHGSSSSFWEDISGGMVAGSGGGGGGGGEDRWWVRGWKKVREWSEIVAGPRWKTFIRRFGKNRGGGGGGRHGKFGYDPLSYAMNFDEGQHDDYWDDDLVFRDFSSRYAAIPASAKSSVDWGRDGPTFF